ncbi:MAG: hypothetical protein A1D16_09400 [Flavihumibacter sp. CACIAM 22H1]|nr:MAG: hypothetical protein A1D16_09400 [Flavihumibacter sp. CACIAM 22H1]
MLPCFIYSTIITMKKVIILFSTLAIILGSCTKEKVVTEEGDGTLNLSFDARVGSEDLALNKEYTIQNKTYKFDQFRYWVSNVILVKADGLEVKIPNSYYLLEETGAVDVQDGSFTYPAKKRETVIISNVPKGEYKTVKFSIGVDSKYNDNLSLQAGELSQLNGMTNVSWMWHTTYIFSALKGSVKEGSTTKSIQVETGLNDNYESLSLQLPAVIEISSKKETAIDLAVSVDKVFDGIDLLTTPSIGAGQATIMQQVATNYATKVFSVKTAQ